MNNEHEQSESSIEHIESHRAVTRVPEEGKSSNALVPRELTPLTDEEHCGFLRQALYASEALQGETDSEHTSRVVSALLRINPRDQFEYMLATQMVALHNLTINIMTKSAHSTNIDIAESAAKTAIKLSRTWIKLHEALVKHRGPLEQQMSVGHVHVADGGQAFVGNVQGGERDKNK